ncbi:MAG: hypothetical protein HRU25_15200 [Psychrobium sp.]|nr:hypothetical protein [Psychrobium sp.]
MDFSKNLTKLFVSLTIGSILLIAPVINVTAIELVDKKKKKAAQPLAVKAPSAGKIYGPIGGNDNLWRISFNHRPDPKLSIDQVMVAIFKANPQAFTDNNMNLLLDGATLNIPSAVDIARISDSEAKAFIAQGGKALPKAVVVTKKYEPPKTVAQDTKVAKVEETPIEEPAVDQLPNDVSSTNMESLSDVNTAGASKQLSLAMSDMQLLIDENKELRDQIAALNDKLDKMSTQEALDLQAHKELATLKDELAEIQFAKDNEHESILNNGWFIGAMSGIPATLMLAGLFFVLSRRKQKDQVEETATKTIEEQEENGEPPELSIEDDLMDDDLLDDDLLNDELLIADDSDDDLLPLDISDDELLVPDSSDELDDVLLDDSSESLDDNVEQDPSNILAQDDLEALLASAEEESNASDSAEGIVSADDLDALLEEAQADVATDDIDALLESANDTVDEDDIDALLAGANDTVDADDIDALVAGANDTVDEDDIDALLAGNEQDVDSDDIDVLLSQTQDLAETDDIAETVDASEDDIDALLSQTQELAETDDITATVDASEDDIDALLSQTQELAETDDITATVDTSEDDIDALLSQTQEKAELNDNNEPVIDEMTELERLSQLDTIDEPYLITEDALHEPDLAKTTITDIKQHIPASPITQVETVQTPEKVEQEQLVSALDDILTDKNLMSTDVENSVNLDELDALLGTDEPSNDSAAQAEPKIHEMAIEVDDDLLASSMAEFDESQVLQGERLTDIDSTVNTSEQADEMTASLAEQQSELSPAEQELTQQLDKFKQENNYIDIDKLLDESAISNNEIEPYKDVDLDTGLDEFPEILPGGALVDVDIDPNGSSKKLDLARAYLEIEDEDSALEILQQVEKTGDEAQISEAKKLLSQLKG